MELEGFGVSLVGRAAWVHGAIPWEFLHSQHTIKILLRSARPTFAEAEMDWTCVWHPQHMRDWSCIATVLRGYNAGSCLIVMDHVVPPGTFWTFLEGMIREGRTVTRLWIHEEPPPVVPDATFFPPTMAADVAQRMLEVFSALPGRAGHGGWVAPADWLAVVTAAAEQGMGLVVTDVEETAWTLLWHRPADSRPPAERRIPTAQHWLRIGMQILDAQGL
jgi:hypothetical protein